jgi:2-amino-4-hydroxy-6-hydroxymethyldihydropteridine diphosphokinase
VGPRRDQPRFYNAVAQVQTTLDPCALLKRCLEVEALMGRRREVVKGPRVIDIDLLLIGDLVASWPELTIPHPELSRRAFVLLPLLEISPMATDPRDDTLLCRLIDSLLRSQSIVKAGRLERPTVRD